MHATSPLLPAEIQTIAELRDLYRAAQARAARLRLLSETGGELATACGGDFEATLARCARRLAHFLGEATGALRLAPDGPGIAVPAPGDDQRVIARLDIPGFPSLEAIEDREDRDAVRMCVQWLATAIDRIEREVERGRLLEALQERERRLEALVGRLFSAQEDERRRVSRELHDGVAQKAGALFRMLEAARPPQPHLAAIAQELVRELRGVIAGLRPTILDDLGLEAALRALAGSLREDGYQVEEDISAARGRWPANLETAFYRVAQEALANIRKHAGGPCLVQIRLAQAPADDGWILEIRDHGAAPGGPGSALAGPGPDDGHRIGIAVMRERMAAVGGALHWERLNDGGVLVRAQVRSRG